MHLINTIQNLCRDTNCDWSKHRQRDVYKRQVYVHVMYKKHYYTHSSQLQTDPLIQDMFEITVRNGQMRKMLCIK